jgi:hypothetical protein
MERLASLNTTFLMILEKEKQLHVSALRPSSGSILGLKEKYFIASPCWRNDLLWWGWGVERDLVLQWYLGALVQVGCGECLLLPMCGWLAVRHGVFRDRCDAGTRGLVHVCSWISVGFCGCGVDDVGWVLRCMGVWCVRASMRTVRLLAVFSSVVILFQDRNGSCVKTS